MTFPTRYSCLQKFFGATSERLLKVFSRDFGYTPRSKSAPVCELFSSRMGQTRGRGVRVRKHSRPPRRSSPHVLPTAGDVAACDVSPRPDMRTKTPRRHFPKSPVPARGAVAGDMHVPCFVSAFWSSSKRRNSRRPLRPRLTTSAPAPFPYPEGTRSGNPRSSSPQRPTASSVLPVVSELPDLMPHIPPISAARCPNISQPFFLIPASHPSRYALFPFVTESTHQDALRANTHPPLPVTVLKSAPCASFDTPSAEKKAQPFSARIAHVPVALGRDVYPRL